MADTNAERETSCPGKNSLAKTPSDDVIIINDGNNYLNLTETMFISLTSNF